MKKKLKKPIKIIKLQIISTIKRLNKNRFLLSTMVVSVSLSKFAVPK